MATPPLVSVITPAYNAAPYIGAAIESVLSQTYPHWEMIVVDDGSTDDTAAVVKRYVSRDQRVRYVYQENQRMASARNTGIRHARGAYVAFLDADNLFLPHKLERQVAYLESHPECGVCYGKIYHMYQNQPGVYYQNRIEEQALSDDFFQEIFWRNFINVLAVMVRKEVLDPAGAFPQGWRTCDEQYLWITLAHRGVRFSPMENIVGVLRLHRTNDSKRADHIYHTAQDFLRLIPMVESWLTPPERQRYAPLFERARARYRRTLRIGRIMAHPLCSWALLPLYLWRRERNYYVVTNPQLS